MTGERGSRGGGGLFLLGLVLLLFVAQYVGTKPTASPAATQAIRRWVAADRRQSAIRSQESSQGYVIDPALASRMLADTALQVRVTGIRGFSDKVIARARVTAPGVDGNEVSTIRYFAVTRTPEWAVSAEARPRDWHLKLW